MKQNLVYIRLEFPIVIEPDDDGFHAYCALLKGLHTSGANEYQARANVREAIKAYIQSVINHNEPLPQGLAVR